MKSQKSKVVNKRGICLIPPNEAKGETILDRIESIV